MFTEEKNFNVINGTVGDPGDIYFAYYVDDEITRNIPSQDSGYTLDTEKSNCTNDVTVGWDQSNWTALINYQKYNATDYTRTKCNLYFKQATYCDLHYETMTCQITTLAATDTTNLAVDEAGNTRFIGADPNNYVSIDGDIWRIIGVMKDVDDGTGNKEDRVKLIRASSIGNYSWDTSESSVNSGHGVNEWSQADLMKLLNPGYESETVGGSLYWNSGSGTCYVSDSNATASCDFTSTGIKGKLKTLIGDAVWNTGSNGTNDYTSSSNGLAKHFYIYERSDNNGKICSSGSSCNDTVERTTAWKGLVGLMYPSDYGYATSGGSTTNRTTCLNTTINSSSSNSDCYSNNWLNNRTIKWSLSPIATSSSAFGVFNVSVYQNSVFFIIASKNFDVWPVVYLSSNVKISGGDGTSELPFTLSL